MFRIVRYLFGAGFSQCGSEVGPELKIQVFERFLMVSSVVDQLLKENQTCLLRERRATNRTTFTRPVVLTTGRGQRYDGFSRDISNQGIGIIDQEKWPAGTIVEIEIHSLFGRNMKARAEARWSDAYGDGWYVTGWHFLDV